MFQEETSTIITSVEDLNLDCFNCSINITDQQIDCAYQWAGPGLLSSSMFQSLITIMYSAIFLVAFVGNGVVCFIVRAFPRMRTVTNYFIANLALGDILMSVFCVPFTFISQLLLNHWPFGLTLCRLVNYSQAVSVMVSAYTLVALAADRYRAITRPLRPRLSKPAAQGAIAAVWIGALATAAPIPIVSALVQPTRWHEACHKSICREEWPLPEQSYYYSMALMTLQFVVPLAVLIITYTRIAIAVWGERPPGEAENSRDKRMAKSKRKMIKMMLTVVVVFTVCWLPLNVLIILWSIHENDTSWDSWDALPYVWFAFHWLAMSHSCYNPIIYCYMNARFRYGFIQVAAKVPCLRRCLGRLARQAARADLHNGVNMTETSLHRVNTCTTYISLRKRAICCSCAASHHVRSPSRSPGRNSCSRSMYSLNKNTTCSSSRSTICSSLTNSPNKTFLHRDASERYQNRLTCANDYAAEGCGNRLNNNQSSPNFLPIPETCLHRSSESIKSLKTLSSTQCSPMVEGCRGNCHSDLSPTRSFTTAAAKNGSNVSFQLNNRNPSVPRICSSPVRAASLLTTQGTICASDRRNVNYLEDQL